MYENSIKVWRNLSIMIYSKNLKVPFEKLLLLLLFLYYYYYITNTYVYSTVFYKLLLQGNIIAWILLYSAIAPLTTAGISIIFYHTIQLLLPTLLLLLLQYYYFCHKYEYFLLKSRHLLRFPKTKKTWSTLLAQTQTNFLIHSQVADSNLYIR